MWVVSLNLIALFDFAGTRADGTASVCPIASGAASEHTPADAAPLSGEFGSLLQQVAPQTAVKQELQPSHESITTRTDGQADQAPGFNPVETSVEPQKRERPFGHEVLGKDAVPPVVVGDSEVSDAADTSTEFQNSDAILHRSALPARRTSTQVRDFKDSAGESEASSGFREQRFSRKKSTLQQEPAQPSVFEVVGLQRWEAIPVVHLNSHPSMDDGSASPLSPSQSQLMADSPVAERLTVVRSIVPTAAEVVTGPLDVVHVEVPETNYKSVVQRQDVMPSFAASPSSTPSLVNHDSNTGESSTRIEATSAASGRRETSHVTATSVRDIQLNAAADLATEQAQLTSVMFPGVESSQPVVVPFEQSDPSQPLMDHGVLQGRQFESVSVQQTLSTHVVPVRSRSERVELIKGQLSSSPQAAESWSIEHFLTQGVKIGENPAQNWQASLTTPLQADRNVSLFDPTRSDFWNQATPAAVRSHFPMTTQTKPALTVIVPEALQPAAISNSVEGLQLGEGFDVTHPASSLINNKSQAVLTPAQTMLSPAQTVLSAALSPPMLRQSSGRSSGVASPSTFSFPVVAVKVESSAGHELPAPPISFQRSNRLQPSGVGVPAKAPEVSSEKLPGQRSASLLMGFPEVAGAGSVGARLTDGTVIEARNAIEQIASTAVLNAELVVDGESQRFEMRLDPPELGELTIEIHRSSTGKVSVHVTAVSPETQSLLQDHSQNLKETLSNQGMSLTDSDLSSQQDRTPEQAPQYQEQFEASRLKKEARENFRADKFSPVPERPDHYNFRA